MCELTCDSHASVVFAFLYGFHDLVGAAHKTLGTPLETNAITRRASVQRAGPSAEPAACGTLWGFQRESEAECDRVMQLLQEERRDREEIPSIHSA